jgi:carbamoyltransferase
MLEHSADYFGGLNSSGSPYMLLVSPLSNDKRTDVGAGSEGLQGLDKLKAKRSEVPAITHVDYSARVQTVDADRHGRYHKLIKRFYELTGCPVIINTSFNVRGEPIVCSPDHAYHCFMATNMDVLVMEDYVLLKKEQPEGPDFDLDAYLAQFELD